MSRPARMLATWVAVVVAAGGVDLAAAAHVVFEGEEVARAAVCITRCACASTIPDQDHEVGAPVCGGPCHDCWDCRIDCSGVTGGD